MKRAFIFLAALSAFFVANAQTTFPVNGVRNKVPSLFAFINATIFIDYKTSIEKATLIINEGIIVDAGKSVSIPKGARVIDLKGKFIYPSFIDIYTTYGIKEEKNTNTSRVPQFISSTPGAYGWNQAIRPETDAYRMFTADEKAAAAWRSKGFGMLLTFNNDGIARGSSALVLPATANENDLFFKSQAAAHYSFLKGSSTQNYPGSVMGAVALLRQSYYDAQWYRNNFGTEFNISLEAWNKLQSLPQIFESDSRFTSLRADRTGDEFGVQYIIKGSGDEYLRLEELKKTNASFIIPINFPLAYDVEDPFDALQISTADLKHWEMAPYNPARLQKAGFTFCITSAGLNEKDFYKNLRKAIKFGLSEQEALRALTWNPAMMLGIEKSVGSLKKGMLANFLITSDSIFKEDCIFYENWVKGNQYNLKPLDLADIRGSYRLYTGIPGEATITIGGDQFDPDLSITSPEKRSAKGKLNYSGEQLSFNVSIQGDSLFSPARMTGWIEHGTKYAFRGKGVFADGTTFDWYAEKTAGSEQELRTVKGVNDSSGYVTYPFTDYGFATLPSAQNFIIRNATVWTNENDSVMLNTDVRVTNGKISEIGRNLKESKDFILIDGTGMHLTCGIIDEHSHIAIYGGVNEGTQSVTSEVRIGDVINSEDINIYRQLAGGVTISQLLHGSANAIGGQSAIIKLRWGLAPEFLKFEAAAPFIKFALGENVKQSNWGERAVYRYPQTRMGVEQIFFDAFYRAKEYSIAKEKKLPLRTDLELEALVEILNNKRFITCHSYVQSEINMLLHVADSMRFKVNTFTHVLEGYKVADKIRKHGAGCGTFADWWAYKYEVIDAIPYNASLLHRTGVTTAINSDDAEMGRRLNQEAAKIVKYGGLTETEAWKMVTLYPARLLHIDHRVGSIRVGKDADLVLWSDNPLSVYAIVQKTFIDGICYYDISNDRQKREEIRRERARLIRKMAEAVRSGEKTRAVAPGNDQTYHCEP